MTPEELRAAAAKARLDANLERLLGAAILALLAWAYVRCGG